MSKAQGHTQYGQLLTDDCERTVDYRLQCAAALSDLSHAVQ